MIDRTPLIRRAKPDDVPALAAIKAACWPAERVAVEHLARALSAADRVTLVAEDNSAIVGFVDGFLTQAADGTRRWELDLLAVHPAAQGRGLGRALITACVAAGARFLPAYSRALIRLENIASQRAFAAAAFAPAGTRCRLMINTAGVDGRVEPPPDAHLVPVMTLTYRGVWLEGRRTAGAFAAARDMRARHGWDVAGSVIPLTEEEALLAASEAGYVAAGDYVWWVHTPL